MRALWPLTCLLLLPLAEGVASGAEVTDMPAAMQGLGRVQYSGLIEYNALEEAGERVAGRRVQRHDLDYHLAFAPLDGLALTLGISHTPSVRYRYPDARPMLMEPVDGGGTYLLSDPGGTHVVQGAGLNGVWLGAAFAPFAERYARNQQATWRLDVAFRTGSPKRNLWTAPNGKRGSAPGGTALKLQGAFSRDLGVGHPWLQVAWTHENKVTVDLTDESGMTWAQDVVLRPASTVDILGGIELVAVDDRDTGARFAVDLYLGFGYRSWEDVASGVYLPHVVSASRQIPVTAGEQIHGRAGIAFDYHVNDAVRFRTGPDVRVHTPFRPEHVYHVRTRAENIAIGWMFRFEGILDVEELQSPAP